MPSPGFHCRCRWPYVPPAYFPKILHTGSTATFLSPGASAVKALLEQAHRHCMITYDPNIRPALLGSHTEAKAIFEEPVALTDVVKLSDEDAQWLYPRKSLDETATRILGLGTRLTVITRGAEGSQFTSDDTNISIPAVKRAVADTIGAGDSYMSALILGFLTRGTEGFAPAVLEQLGHTAAAAAAITVQRRGANPPTLEELNAAVEANASALFAGACSTLNKGANTEGYVVVLMADPAAIFSVRCVIPGSPTQRPLTG